MAENQIIKIRKKQNLTMWTLKQRQVSNIPKKQVKEILYGTITYIDSEGL